MRDRPETRMPHRACLAALLLAATPAFADERPTGPGVVARGSSDVTVEGLPAARGGDPTTTGAPVTEGSPNVTINGRPAVRVGDRTACGVVVQGAKGVFINGRPMGRAGDATSGC